MKKYLALGLLSSFLLTSCSIDWNDAKEKRIEELEKQITEMKKEYKKPDKKEMPSVKKTNVNPCDNFNVDKKIKSMYSTYAYNYEIDSILYNTSINSCLIDFSIMWDANFKEEILYNLTKDEFIYKRKKSNIWDCFFVDENLNKECENELKEFDIKLNEFWFPNKIKSLR